LRAGQVTITSAETISRSFADPAVADFSKPEFEIFAPITLTPIAPSKDKN
jgi:hypothetical protein